jgi:hypothetical protein
VEGPGMSCISGQVAAVESCLHESGGPAEAQCHLPPRVCTPACISDPFPEINMLTLVPVKPESSQGPVGLTRG